MIKIANQHKTQQKTDIINFCDKKISRIGLGTMSLGGDLYGDMSEKLACEILERSLEQGIRLFNTAAFYGNGKSEKLCGKILKSSDLGKEVVIITKGGLYRDPQTNKFFCDASSETLRRSIEASLTNLGLTSLDVYQLHWPDNGTPIYQTAKTLLSLQEEGLIHKIGICNSPPNVLEELMKYITLDNHELSFNIFDPSLRKTITTSQTMGLKILVWGALAHGLLSDNKYDGKWHERDFRRHHPWFKEPNITNYQKACQALRIQAKKYDKTLTQLAIRYVLDEPGVTIALWGIHHPDQLSSIKGALEWSLTQEERSSLENIVKSYISIPKPRTHLQSPPSRFS